MLVKRAVGSEWGWEAALPDDEFPEERGPAVIPFRMPPAAATAEASRALPTPKAFSWDRSGELLEGGAQARAARTGLMMESAAPAEPWPQRPVVRREEVVPATAPAPQVRAAEFRQISRAEAAATVAPEPFRNVLQRYAEDQSQPRDDVSPAPHRAPTPKAATTQKATAEAAQPDVRQTIPAQTERRGAPVTKHVAPPVVRNAEAAAERAFEVLTSIGLDDDIAEQALFEAVRVMPAEALTASERLVEVALARLVAALPKGPPLSAVLAGCQLFFIGPAGAGKTTATLKTAVRLRDAGVDTGIVATDMSRIGAREQVERYGELLRLPVAVAYTPSELSQIIEAAPPRRVLLIDTAASGPGPRTPQPLQQCAPDLAALLSVAPRRVPVLVAPAGAREADLRRLANLARTAGASAATLTRLDDESDAPVPREALPGAGLALNALARLGLPPLLCSIGRDVLTAHAAPSAMALAVAALESAVARVQ